MKTFKTNSVIIRKFQMKDAKQQSLDFLLDNDSNIIPDNIYEDFNFEKNKLVIKSAINEYYTDEPVWAVESKDNKKIIGYVRVCNYSAKNKTCNVTWAISIKYWEDDSMKDALRQIFNFLYSKKNIDLIECSYYQQDDKNNQVLEEIGMKKEAILRDRRINEKTKEKENFVIYSINRKEFFESVNEVVIGHHYYKQLKRKI